MNNKYVSASAHMQRATEMMIMWERKTAKENKPPQMLKAGEGKSLDILKMPGTVSRMHWIIGEWAEETETVVGRVIPGKPQKSQTRKRAACQRSFIFSG